ncbi:MAG TPA: [protein-PII] uridylyltransferase, partial [Acidimicrobiia bacterium]|nr:[protein-PII] uridylyltransferase [Acidimicrobiia bacterium]
MLRDTTLRGSAFGRAYTDLVDEWVHELIGGEAGIAVIAVGGYGRRELCPGSDLDILLLHNGQRTIASVADRLWYPLWDAGLAVDHSVRTPRQALASANEDMRVVLGLLDGRVVLGDAALGRTLLRQVRSAWRDNARRRLPGLDDATTRRHESAGEVAFLLEPDLKEGHGGLRDVTTVAAMAEAANFLEIDPQVAESRDRLLEVRVVLQQITGGRSNILGLEQQDAVAAALGVGDADVLMQQVAAAARVISWQIDDSWQRVRSWIARPRRRRSAPADADLGYGMVLRDGEVTVTAPDLCGDATTIPRLAGAAAYLGAPIQRSALRAMARDAPPLTGPWPNETREAFVSLLGAGTELIRVLETLDQWDLVTRLIPEWAHVRSRPQRNAFHQFTVDRHLMEAAARASAFARRVERPDLLLVGAFFHDLGKGYPGDHTAAGVRLMRTIGDRMGFDVADVGLLQQLVAQHLLLAKVATSRDLSDPRTLRGVADEVGDIATLELLYALTEADSLATGPTAWTSWRAELIGDLVAGVRDVLGGAERPAPQPQIIPPAGPPPSEPVVAVQDGTIRVVGRDRPGLFTAAVGLLALHGQDVRAARAASSPDVAVAEFDVEPIFGRPIDPAEFERELVAAADERLDLDAELEKRAQAYDGLRLPRAARPAAPVVLVDRGATPPAAIVEVRAPDAIGMLYRIARALRDSGLDIRLA